MKSSIRLVFGFVSLITLVARGAAAEPPAKQPSAAETFVYVHGAWNGGFFLKRIEQLLRAQGNEVYRPTLTGLGERVNHANRDIDLNTHIEDIVNVILWEDLREVVLVGRSYGGMVVTGVADRVPDRIKRRIYIDAFLPADGESLMDISPRQVKVGADGFVLPPGKVAAEKPPHLVPQPAKTFTKKISLGHQEAVARIPTTYILTVDAGKAAEQDQFFKFSERARALGWKVVTMQADHGPEMSQPEALLPLLTTP